MRDRRFVAVNRGGLLSKEHHRLLINWAQMCATHVISYFEQSKIDERLNGALKLAKAWEREKFLLVKQETHHWKQLQLLMKSQIPFQSLSLGLLVML